MTKLIPLKDIPYSARKIESKARKSFASRDAALEGAKFEIVVAPGCHSRPYFDPPRIGWVCSNQAASALAARRTYMPGGTSHCRATFVQH